MMFWPWERSAEVLKAWAEWARSAPDEVTTSARLMQIPPLPDIPEFLQGRALIVIDGAYVGDEASGAALLAAAARPRSRDGHVRDDAARRAVRIHMDPEGPTPAIAGGGRMLGELTDGRSTPRGRGRPGLRLGAADERAAPPRRRPGPRARGAGALARFHGEYMMFGVGIPVTPELAAAIHGGLATLADALAPWDDRLELPQLRRGAGRPRAVLLRRELRAPAPRQGRGRPRGPFPGQPRDRRRLSTQMRTGRAGPTSVGSAERPLFCRFQPVPGAVQLQVDQPVIQDHGAHDETSAR